MSYAHADDGEGQVMTFGERLEQELRVLTGRGDIEIFMDADIELGAPWAERIARALTDSAFLLPIVTPSFLRSEYCREELQAFLAHEKALGRKDLILPIYYVECAEDLVTRADPVAEASWKAISSRQYFPWHHLRHKSPTEEEVRVERTRLAKQIQKALARPRPEQPSADAQPSPPRDAQTSPDAAPSIAPSPPPAAKSPPSPPSPPTAAGTELPLEDLFDPDPVRSRPAAEEVAARGADAIPAVVERLQGMTKPTIFILRELLAQFPDVSGPLMLERIEGAQEDWHRAALVPECLTPEHVPVCEGRLVQLMRESDDVDVVRMAIEGLGYLGSVDAAAEIGPFLKEKAESRSGYFYDKYSGYCITALARIVGLTPMQPAFLEHNLGFDYLEPAIELVSARGWQSIVYPNLQEILSRYKSHHGSRLLNVWLTSDNEDTRHLGAYALGGIGLGWAVPALLGHCLDPGEDDRVRRAAAFAAGATGGPEAVEGLRSLETHDEVLAGARDNALALCLGDLEDEGEFRALAEDLIVRRPSELCWVYRAIGLRGDYAMLFLAEGGVRAEETSVRGDAALALARLVGPDAADTLRRAARETSSTRETLLISLALLRIGEEAPGDPQLEQLRDLLATESAMYRSVTQQDILDSLRAAASPLAAEIADAWEPVYAASSAY
jgi:hypothetical protein